MIAWLADSLYSGIIGLWWHIYALPWPPGRDWFRWFIFLVLGKVVWWCISRVLLNNRRGSDTNSAAAIVSSLFDRH